MRGDSQILAAYAFQPRVEKPYHDILEDLDRLTMEVLPGDPAGWMYSYVILPPLAVDGIHIKGILMSMAAEFLIDRHPDIQRYFHVLASSQTFSFPWSRRADGLCASYANPQRNAWFRWRYPDRRTVLLPVQEADWTNEVALAPQRATRAKDLLCVSRQLHIKNLPLLPQV